MSTQKTPVFLGILFFDLMIKSAAQQGIQNHMWLFYLQYIVEKLEETYDTSDISVNTSDEFPTHGAKLIYDALATLCGWVYLVYDLPKNSSHRQFSQYESVSTGECQHWHYDPEINGNIPLCAAVAVGSCMATIITSDQIDGEYKDYLYEVVLNTIKRLRKDGEDGYLRKFLICAIINGGNTEIDTHYGRHLISLFDNVDYALQSHVDDYEMLCVQYTTIIVR